MTNTVVVLSGACLGEQEWLALDEFACAVSAEFVGELVAEGLVAPPEPGRFGGDELARVRRIRRLQRDFEANLQSVAVMLELIDEVERLRAALLRSGAAA
jgi:chaperone modulatory protein CbpM